MQYLIHRYTIATMIIFLMIAANSAVAQPSQSVQIVIKQVDTQQQKIHFKMDISKAPLNLNQLSARVGEENLQSKISTQDQKIWLLVDSSKLCQTYKVAEYTSLLLDYFKRILSSGSTISVVEYVSGEIRTRVSEQVISETSGYQVQCQPGALSSNYEQALQSLIEQNKGKNLPDSIWILSSGNVKVSEKIQDFFQRNNLRVHIGLYNPFIQNVVGPILLKQPVTYSSMWNNDLSTAISPPFSIQMEVNVPDHFLDKKTEFTIELKSSDVVLAKTERLATIQSQGWTRWVKEYAIWALWILLGLVALLGIFLIVRRIRKPICSKCNTVVRSDDRVCFNCEDGAFLLQHQEKKEKLIPISPKGLTFGSSRKANIRVHSPKIRRSPEYRIVPTAIKDGRYLYEIQPSARSKKPPLFINGVPITKDRLIGHADQMTIDGSTYTFLYSKKLPKRHKGSKDVS